MRGIQESLEKVEGEKVKLGGGMKMRERELRRNKMLMPPLAIALQRKKRKLGRPCTRLPKSCEEGRHYRKNNPYERLYPKLEIREGEKDVFELARLREKKTRDLGNIRCIKDEDGKVLVEEATIQERWRSYFSTLFNDESEYSTNLESGVQEGHLVEGACSCISKEEVRDALRKMKSGEVAGPDLIPMDI